MDALMAATVEQIVETPGIGEVLAEQIVETLEDERTQELISRLRERGLRMELAEDEKAPATGPLVGKTFVITGTLPNLSREEATARIEEAGGKVTGSVSKKTDYLLLGADPGSKLAKAEKVGTEIIDEERLLELLA
jgi:DNA ligase (NAD+)